MCFFFKSKGRPAHCATMSLQSGPVLIMSPRPKLSTLNETLKNVFANLTNIVTWGAHGHREIYYELS